METNPVDSAQLRAEKMPCSHKARPCSSAPGAEPLPAQTPVVQGPLLAGHSRLLKPSSHQLCRQRSHSQLGSAGPSLQALFPLWVYSRRCKRMAPLGTSEFASTAQEKAWCCQQRTDPKQRWLFCMFFFFFSPHHHRVMSSLLQHARQGSQPCPRHAQHQGDLGIYCPSGISH